MAKGLLIKKIGSKKGLLLTKKDTNTPTFKMPTPYKRSIVKTLAQNGRTTKG